LETISLPSQAVFSMSQDISLLSCVHQIEQIALQEFDRQIQTQHLYYHTRDHLAQVQRRSHLIFEAIRSDLDVDLGERIELLLEVCALAHDMVQIFEPQPQPHTTRKRSPGVSETATIARLVDCIQAHCPTELTEPDLAMIRAAIAATICQYDAQEQAIYQPALKQRNLPIVARILALADLGALGIDGIAMYNREGSLLFLEENIDVIPLLQSGEITQLETVNPALAENIRQRLLNRSRFQINFAKSRLARIDQELEGFPENKIQRLRQEVFHYLNEATIREIEVNTPTCDRTSLPELLQFFSLEKYL
jgi:hypothetical protein